MPYIVKTKTPPIQECDCVASRGYPLADCRYCGGKGYYTSGAMACCHSTIGAGRCGHMIEQSRRAVATLEEARDEAIARLSDDAPGWDESGWTPTDVWRDHFDAIATLPKAGGTIGPLPDGTMIEVEHLKWDELRDRVPHALEYDHGKRGETIIDAYNAAQ